MFVKVNKSRQVSMMHNIHFNIILMEKQFLVFIFSFQFLL